MSNKNFSGATPSEVTSPQNEANETVKLTFNVQLTNEELDIINKFKKSLESVNNKYLSAFDDALTLGKLALQLKDHWVNRLSALSPEGYNFKNFVADHIGKDYSWIARLMKAAKVELAVVDLFKQNAKELGYPVSIEGLNAFVSGGGNGGKGSGGKGSDVIKWSDVHIKMEDGKIKLVKGTEKQIHDLIKQLQSLVAPIA